MCNNTRLLAEGVSELVIKQYDSLKISNKPSIKSNGIKEWTVLAGIVAIDENTNELRLISVATGVKALPNEELERSHGRMLHDSHAEILALRAFNVVLLKQMALLAANPTETCDLVERCNTTHPYRMRKRWKIALYISRPPCGDCSMDILGEDDTNYMQFSFDDCCQYINPGIRTTLRGRFNYDCKGVTRTKPGRPDSKITLSKSCSDKLASKQVISILNSTNWKLLETPVFLSYLVLPQHHREKASDGCLRNFHYRLLGLNEVHSIEMIFCSKKFNGDKEEESQTPCPISGVYINIKPMEMDIEEGILNGVLNGFYVKATRPLRKNCESILSRSSFWTLFTQLGYYVNSNSYLDFKSKQTSRNQLKEQVRLHLSSDGWIPTSADDCF
ncbi:tRNA-specific adenosine deaminase Ecym_2596 [Eremothecium cymbalariae DBVPG|uniref:A to I editase domain-containing protein n=1 Tax=Eremothecium cymbalariae (strain CBS 270.75 / DBVPG 7215 / KCTC 17166 / NRRL Y-17582) TaxID=931890 RepID=G8JQH7_ERECY|nr:Hypothetical protein Ecym_2596 [Eremothecium cymbalariae DBVPG\